jgi:hypothetical protein
LFASNTTEPIVRSRNSTSRAAVRIGKASSTSRLVTRMFQVMIGIRNIVMPGARIVTIVVTKLTPPRIVPRPDSARPTIQRSPPMPGELIAFVSGVYAVQPKSAAPLGVKKPAFAVIAPNR